MSILKDMLEECIRHPDQLPDRFTFGSEERTQLNRIAERYPICIPPYYLNLVSEEWKDDPIRKLCIPDVEEISFGGHEDTSGEAGNTVVPGMQHKYGPTALILTTNQCSMYCRHCFRKRMVGSNAEEVAKNIGLMTEYVSAHPEINNIILSGGDALINENSLLRRYLEAFSDIDTVKTIRIATRVPVVLPARIYEDPELLDMLEEYNQRKQLVVVTHFNHPREVTDEAKRAVHALLRTGCPVRNQTVLLKGVNDDSDTLSRLMNQLVSCGVMPYYIFQCRPAMGVMNQFQVPLLEGQRIIDEAKSAMSGLAKAFRYVMSHVTGKIEILGKSGDGSECDMLFKYHQAKDPGDNARFFSMKIGADQCWLPEQIGG